MSWTSWGFDNNAEDVKKIYSSSSVVSLGDLPDWMKSISSDSIKIKESSMNK
jgi:hypothetical protein